MKLLTKIIEKHFAELNPESQKREHVEARQVFCMIASFYKGIRAKEIGLFLGKDRTSVIGSIKHISDIYITEPEFREKYHSVLAEYIRQSEIIPTIQSQVQELGKFLENKF